jgi:hypothetical protein
MSGVLVGSVLPTGLAKEFEERLSTEKGQVVRCKIDYCSFCYNKSRKRTSQSRVLIIRWRKVGNVERLDCSLESKEFFLREGGNNAVYAITIELNNKFIML